MIALTRELRVFLSIFYNSIYFSIFAYVFFTISIFYICRKLGILSKCINWVKIAFISLKSGYDAHSIFFKELFGNCLVFFIAYKCFEKIPESKSMWSILIAVLVAFIKALLKSLRIKKGIGKEFESIYDSKLELAKIFLSYTAVRPPYFYRNMLGGASIETLVRDVLKSQVNFISQTYKPGWSWGGHEFSVSLLFYNYTNKSWELFDTFYEEKAERRQASTWPMSKTDFSFPSDLYTHKSNRKYNLIELEKPDYESVLQIPLYFRKNYKSHPDHIQGNVFAIISFASRKKEAFQKVDRNSKILRRFFIPEIYILEKYIYKLYRLKV